MLKNPFDKFKLCVGGSGEAGFSSGSTASGGDPSWSAPAPSAPAASTSTSNANLGDTYNAITGVNNNSSVAQPTAANNNDSGVVNIGTISPASGMAWNGTAWAQLSSIPSYALGSSYNGSGVAPVGYIGSVNGNQLLGIDTSKIATIYNPLTGQYQANNSYTGTAYTSLGYNNETQGIPTGYPGNIGVQPLGGAYNIYNNISANGGLVNPDVIALAMGQGNQNAINMYSPVQTPNIVGSAYALAVEAARRGDTLDPTVYAQAVKEGFGGSVRVPVLNNSYKSDYKSVDAAGNMVGYQRQPIINMMAGRQTVPDTFLGDSITQSPLSASNSRTVYSPYGNQTQTEVKDIGAIRYDAAGQVAFYQNLYDPNTGALRSTTNLVSSGGRNALQGGGFTLDQPETPYVVKQWSGEPPVFNAGMSNLGSEAYGGFVLPLDNRTVESTGATLSTYTNPLNLANLVDPYAVNQPKASLPNENLPWGNNVKVGDAFLAKVVNGVMIPTDMTGNALPLVIAPSTQASGLGVSDIAGMQTPFTSVGKSAPMQSAIIPSGTGFGSILGAPILSIGQPIGNVGSNIGIPGSFSMEQTIIKSEPSVGNLALNIGGAIGNILPRFAGITPFKTDYGFGETTITSKYQIDTGITDRSKMPIVGGTDYTGMFIGSDNKPTTTLTEKVGTPFMKDGQQYQNYKTTDLSKTSGIYNVSKSETTTEKSVKEDWNASLSGFIPAQGIDAKPAVYQGGESVLGMTTSKNSPFANAYNHVSAWGFGFYNDFQQKPLDAVQNAAFAIILAAATDGVGNWAVATAEGTRAASIVETIGKYTPLAMGTVYTGSVAARSTNMFTDFSPAASQRLGGIMSTETIPFVIGGYGYSRLSSPSEQILLNSDQYINSKPSSPNGPVDTGFPLSPREYALTAKLGEGEISIGQFNNIMAGRPVGYGLDNIIPSKAPRPIIDIADINNPIYASGGTNVQPQARELPDLFNGAVRSTSPEFSGTKGIAISPSSTAGIAIEPSAGSPKVSYPYKGDANVGWKLHLGFDETNPHVVSKISDYLSSQKLTTGADFKIGHGGGAASGQPGKEATIYVGSKANAETIANKINADIGHLLNTPTPETSPDIFSDDVLISGKVHGRFVAGNIIPVGYTTPDFAFQQYGGRGIPYTGQTKSDVHWGGKSPDAAFSESDVLLKKTFGDYYGGTQFGSSGKTQMINRGNGNGWENFVGEVLPEAGVRNSGVRALTDPTNPTRSEAMDYIKTRYPNQGSIWDNYLTETQMIRRGSGGSYEGKTWDMNKKAEPLQSPNIETVGGTRKPTPTEIAQLSKKYGMEPRTMLKLDATGGDQYRILNSPGYLPEGMTLTTKGEGNPISINALRYETVVRPTQEGKMERTYGMPLKETQVYKDATPQEQRKMVFNERQSIADAEKAYRGKHGGGGSSGNVFSPTVQKMGGGNGRDFDFVISSGIDAGDQMLQLGSLMTNEHLSPIQRKMQALNEYDEYWLSSKSIKQHTGMTVPSSENGVASLPTDTQPINGVKQDSRLSQEERGKQIVGQRSKQDRTSFTVIRSSTAFDSILASGLGQNSERAAISERSVSSFPETRITQESRNEILAEIIPSVTTITETTPTTEPTITQKPRTTTEIVTVPYIPTKIPPPILPLFGDNLPSSGGGGGGSRNRRRRKVELFSFEMGEDTPIPTRYGLAGQTTDYVSGTRGIAKNILLAGDIAPNSMNILNRRFDDRL